MYLIGCNFTIFRWTSYKPLFTRTRIRARLGGGIPRRSMAGQNFSTITARGTLKTISVKAIIAQSNDSFGAAFMITNIESLIFVESLFVFSEVNLRLTVVATEQINFSDKLSFRTIIITLIILSNPNSCCHIWYVLTSPPYPLHHHNQQQHCQWLWNINNKISFTQCMT